MKLILSIVLILTLRGCYGAKIPPEIPKCMHGDTECIKITSNIVLSKFYKGMSSINLLTLDPIQINAIDIVQGGDSPVNIVLKFRDSQMKGLQHAKVTNVIGFPSDPLNSSNEIQVKTPRLELVGAYSMNGRVLILPIQGNGQANLTLDNVDAKIKFTGKKITKNGKDYMQTDNLKITFTTSRMWMNFGNLFNGDPNLGPSTNAFLNENWNDILNELKPAISAAFGKIIQTIINNVFASVPYKAAFTN